ncbi:MAG: hypothetical protein JWM14_3351 [Chitinophagaceae bacterium]|nr:hypothetical protein [Chitinophagaceae bacterium]
MKRSALILFLFLSTTLVMAQSEGMKQRWEKINANLDKSLPQSAFKDIQDLYAEAKKTHDVDNQVKALIYIMRCQDMSEEDAFVKDIAFVNKEITTAEFPVNAVLHSMLGEMYWRYFQQHHYQSADISAATNVDSTDIQTWDQKTQLTAAIDAFHYSLKDKEALLNYSTDPFTQVIQKSSSNHFYTANLYDFLGRKALKFFQSAEAGVTRPAEQFNLNDIRYFSASSEFIKVKLQTEDTLSLHFYALQLFQDLEKLHLQDVDPTILTDLALSRIKFVATHSGLTNKNELELASFYTIEQATLKFPISTEASYEMATIWRARAEDESGINGSPKYPDANIQSMAICDAAIARFPHALGAENCENLKTNILKPSLDLKIEEVNLVGKAFRSLVHYNNIKTLTLRVVALTIEEVEQLKNDLNYRYDIERFQLFKPYLDRTAIKQWSVDLQQDPQLRQHSTEIVLDALPAGIYLIFASDGPKIIKDKAIFGYGITTVSNLSFVARSDQGKAQLYVLNRATGKPVQEAKVTAYLSEYDYEKRKNRKRTIGQYDSDANGYVEVTVANREQAGNALFDIRTKDDRLIGTNRNSYGMYVYQQDEYHDYSNIHPNSLLIFTDRAIYRPGQTVYFKGIFFDTKSKNNYQAGKNMSLRIAFYDANNKETAALDLVTNEFGSVQGSFTAPVGSLTGNMSIGNDMGRANFNVEEYKRPKFEVKIEPLKGQYKLNQEVTIKAQAKAYAGNAVDGAQVNYRVVRRVEIPYWYKRYWGNFNAQETVIITGSTATDNNGEFTVNFTALPDAAVSSKMKSTFVYTVYADVIDINGETHSDETSISIGYSSLVLNIQVPGKIEKGKPTTLQVTAKNQSGESEAASINVQIFKLQAPEKALRKRLWESPDKPLLTESEFKKLFPEDEYAKETDPANFAQQLILEKVVSTTAEKAGELHLPDDWQTGQYVIKATALDKDQVESQTESNFTKTDPKSDKLPFAVTNWTKVIPASVQPSEKATVEIGSSFSDVHVLCEVERDGKIIRKEFITLHDGIKKLEQPITEEDRGGLSVHYVFVYNNRVYGGTENIQVPFTNKEVTITWETFRNKLLPGQAEEWRLKIKRKNGEKTAAEFLATLYDASLDAFVVHDWPMQLYNNNSSHLSWINNQSPFGTEDFEIWDHYDHYRYYNSKYYDEFNWFGYAFGRDYGSSKNIRKKSGGVGRSITLEESESEISADGAAMPAASYAFSANAKLDNQIADEKLPDEKPVPVDKTEQPAIRKDFRETAFFFPDLKTDEEGNIILKFSMPEALTRWKLLGLAHTKDMSYGTTQQEVVTQKELMVVPNGPRFIREGDKLVLSAKVTNLSGKPMHGTVKLLLFDAATMKPIDAALGNNQPSKTFGEANTPSEVKTWEIKVPGDYQAITYRVIAEAGNFSDGEENIIPVFSNRMLVTESLPMVVTEGQTKTYTLDKLSSNTSKTLVNHRLTLELTPNPIWYAVQALPYLAEYPYECAEQTFSRYYANSLAGFVANSSPELKRMFELWKNLAPDALLSNLEKNQELKMLLLEQTPWLRDAENETEQKRRIGLLFDLTRMNSELDRALGKLDKMQLGNGAWPWFTGMREDRYITQHILTGLAHLKHLGVKGRNDDQIEQMTSKALNYCDGELLKDYRELLKLSKLKKIKLEEVEPSSMEVHYLYGRSFYDKKASGELELALQFYKKQSHTYWTKYALYEQALIGLTAHRDGDKALTALLHQSFKERAIVSEEKGMYWKASEGYYWYQAPIERQAMLIEFFEEVAKDRASVDKMRFWLLTQKQTTHWKTTKATTEACYALLLNGTSWLSVDPTLTVSVGNQKIDFPKSEINPTLTKVWNGPEVKAEQAKVTLSKQGVGIAWGALHWQYYEDLDNITTHKNTQVQLTKELMLEEQTVSGAVLKPITASTTLKAGDLVKVKLVIRSDRDLEYVHVQDMRAAGFEPLNVLSGAKWNNNFGYYESTRDASTDFFIGFLPRGTYVFEYSLRVNNAGNFSNGITNIQCMYAPEFNAHSAGIRVEIK